ncbi:MAG: hypothetical protein IPK63_23735 [Candidatus Competibacteraceae bacterium]|nr:hypothetical protein [Candidatus Competibacteraceae bacterium]
MPGIRRSDASRNRQRRDAQARQLSAAADRARQAEDDEERRFNTQAIALAAGADASEAIKTIRDQIEAIVSGVAP